VGAAGTASDTERHPVDTTPCHGWIPFQGLVGERGESRTSNSKARPLKPRRRAPPERGGAVLENLARPVLASGRAITRRKARDGVVGVAQRASASAMARLRSSRKPIQRQLEGRSGEAVARGRTARTNFGGIAGAS